MVTVTVSETYDLSTKPNKMSLIGIHTPPLAFVRKLWPGLFLNFKQVKFESCDISLACASVLPADPSQIGVEAGAIAPVDMLNPILYKAVSNEAMSTLEARLAGMYPTSEEATVKGQSIVATRENATALEDEFPVYYGLLSNRDGWRVAMPQQGLSMTGLRPLVFEQLYNNGTMTGLNPATDGENYPALRQAGTSFSLRAYSVRGNARPMPAINTTTIPTGTLPTGVVAPGVDAGNIAPSENIGPMAWVAQTATPSVPPIYVGCIVMPPSKLQTLYYRMVVRWHVSFSGLRPISEITDWPAGLGAVAGYTYFSDYVFGSKVSSAKVVNDTAMVSTADASVEKIMEGK
nr:capsid protein [Porcine associated smacovirus]